MKTLSMCLCHFSLDEQAHNSGVKRITDDNSIVYNIYIIMHISLILRSFIQHDLIATNAVRYGTIYDA
ncbi:hypothetical protein BBBOND_0209310 [Babesia bigemina]|uniref:Uncharacterized protein n=1 Tax=Babesia bigemina TaxID=5866 RepID=A0A061D5E5_BABBI|nr:hypothetical protein BBBOND_0209310 [Babesia bigemina]CDR95778.1 hypothetical protein BBBOND_0209310 [Babesia bigemina]|eukprot:XP_012767964.1 hypothetical protein BBBOND_0209310 [Babesia bigemina]